MSHRHQSSVADIGRVQPLATESADTNIPETIVERARLFRGSVAFPAYFTRGREFMSSLRRIAVAVAPLALVVGLGWSAQQSTVPEGQTIGGISCDAQEGQRIHIHQHLVILDRGKAVDIPPRVGQPATKRCIYWLHTHTPDGIIHIEAPKDRSFTLGDFFLVWGQPLNRTAAASARVTKGESLRMWVNGKRFNGDPRSVPLIAHADIVIEVGPPFVKPPKFTTWGAL